MAISGAAAAWLGTPLGLPWGVAPAAIFFAGALISVFLRPRDQAAILVLTPVVGLVNLLYLSDGSYWHYDIIGQELTLLRVDGLSLLFGLIFHLAALIWAVFALHVRDRIQHLSALVYIGGALGAVFAGDLITLFLFWEVLALSSAFLIWARRSERSNGAGLRYLMVHVVSGLLLLTGALLHLRQTGGAAFDFLGLDSTAAWLIFVAFGIKCGFPLLHNWLTDAYPEATPTGTVFLSTFTTKVAIYALARGFPGTELLIYIGAAMTVFPIFYAVIENDLRRVLAYSMINQLGFMVAGIGIGTAMAMNGALSHAFNDVIFKGLLFMTMGAVLHRTGRINGSDLGGLYKTMPFTATLCIIGAASISAFPLFSGFVSKSMVMVALVDEGYGAVWLAMLFASAGVFHHAGIKIPYFAFFAHDSGIRTKEPPWNMLLAMTVAAALCVFNGAYPWLLYDLMPFPVDYAPYTQTHVIAQLQLLFFSALAFAWLMVTGIYPPELRSVNLDVEWIYRGLGARAVRVLGTVIGSADRALRHAARRGLMGARDGIVRVSGPAGLLARTGSTGGAVLWIAAALAAYLAFYYS